MSVTPNKYIRATYQLFNVTDGKNELIEETTSDRTFDFVSGLGLLLKDFELQLVDLNVGDKFDFNLLPGQAYGEYVEERVLNLDKKLFVVNGKFDDKNIYPDAIIPLQNADGDRFNARVLEITNDKVKVDLNHPLAGLTLNFKGEILETREATNEELANYVQLIAGSGDSCGCGSSCESCDSGCGGGHEKEKGGCGCGSDKSEGSCGCGGGHKDGGCGCGSEKGEGGCGCGSEKGEGGCGCSDEKSEGSCGDRKSVV